VVVNAMVAEGLFQLQRARCQISSLSAQSPSRLAEAGLALADPTSSAEMAGPVCGKADVDLLPPFCIVG
jgi:hypothetical protein